MDEITKTNLRYLYDLCEEARIKLSTLTRRANDNDLSILMIQDQYLSYLQRGVVKRLNDRYRTDMCANLILVGAMITVGSDYIKAVKDLSPSCKDEEIKEFINIVHEALCDMFQCVS